jgi:hypothetical protein
MATGNKVGYAMASKGLLTDIDGPTSVASSNGLGQRNQLGVRVFDDLGNEYIYLVGVASTAAGDWVKYVPGAFTTARLVSNTAVSGLVAVAIAATLASCWGWYQIFGLTPAYTAIATDAAADGKALSMGASADGRVTTGATTTKNIFGATAVGASASNVGTASIAYPWMFGSATI